MTALSLAEMRDAAEIGVRRRLLALHKTREQTYGYDGTDYWAMDIESAASEMLVAKHLNVYWAGRDRTDADDGDVDGWGVRWTPRPDGRLILHHEDPSDRRFVLVTGRYPQMVVRGWILAADGKRGEFWREGIRCPCFMVPQRRLEVLL